MFQRVKSKAIIFTNIRAKWKEAGLIPFSPTEVFKRILINTSSFSQFTRILPDQIALKDILLKSSPPENIKLH